VARRGGTEAGLNRPLLEQQAGPVQYQCGPAAALTVSFLGRKFERRNGLGPSFFCRCRCKAGDHPRSKRPTSRPWFAPKIRLGALRKPTWGHLFHDGPAPSGPCVTASKSPSLKLQAGQGSEANLWPDGAASGGGCPSLTRDRRSPGLRAPALPLRPFAAESRAHG